MSRVALSPERAANLGRRSVQVRRVAAVERRLRELADAEVPLTDEQRHRLALLLRGGAA